MSTSDDRPDGGEGTFSFVTRLIDRDDLDRWREPDCEHTTIMSRQPMSACRVCRDSQVLQEWRDYWEGKD